jgi:hypothetical protein
MSAIALLSGDKQTSGKWVEIDAIDPKVTSAGDLDCASVGLQFLGIGARYEAARVHRIGRWWRGGVAACGRRAAAFKANHRIS